jgi:hypothetical protein
VEIIIIEKALADNGSQAHFLVFLQQWQLIKVICDYMV